MRGVSVSCLFIFRGCQTVILVLQKQVGQLIVDDRRFFVRWERNQKFTVPKNSLFEVIRFFLLFRRFLLGGMVVMGQIGQIGFQTGQNILAVAGFEIIPVFGLQTIIFGKGLLVIQNQGGKSSGSMDFDYPHVKIGCTPMKGVAANECLVCGIGIGITAFVKVKFSKVAVDAVLIAALAVAGKIFSN